MEIIRPRMTANDLDFVMEEKSSSRLVPGKGLMAVRKCLGSRTQLFKGVVSAIIITRYLRVGRNDPSASSRSSQESREYQWYSFCLAAPTNSTLGTTIVFASTGVAPPQSHSTARCTPRHGHVAATATVSVNAVVAIAMQEAVHIKC